MNHSRPRVAHEWANRSIQRFAHSPFINKGHIFKLYFVLWVAFFALYAATTARDILPADSGEFQLVAAKWGIAHPPGYPLYTIVSALWVWLFPLGSSAFRTNLLSAALAATTLVLICETVRIWSRAWGVKPRPAVLGGLAAALLLGNATTFWAQATIANIRMPTMLFVAWGFLALAHYRAGIVTQNSELSGAQNPRGFKIPPLIELAIALGLGAGHHPSIIFVASGWAVYLMLIDPKVIVEPRRWWKAVPTAALTWLLPQLYLPLRDSMQHVPLAPGNLATWSGFWDHVLARGFGGDMFAFATKTDLALRLPLLPTLFQLQFPPVFLAAIGVSWLWLLWRRRKIALALAFTWGIHTFVTITYRAPQTVEYLMPAYAPMVIAFGLSLSAFVEWVESRKLKTKNHTSRFAFYVLQFTFYTSLLVLLLRFPGHFRDFATLAADTSIRDRTAPLLDIADPDATILADWHWATPLWVLQHVEGHNSDVNVAYVYPVAGQEYEDVWRARAEASSDNACFTTHSFDWDGWTFAAVGGGFRLYRRPLTHLPDNLKFTPLKADLGIIQVAGYRLNGDVQPGRQIELHVAWQASGPQNPSPSLTARLWDAQGNLLAQADRALPGDSTLDEVRFAHITLQLPFDRCTSTIHPTLGGYIFKDNAFQDLGEVELPELSMTCDFPRLPVVHPWPGRVTGGPWLRGIDYDDLGQSAMIAYLHWCGPGGALTVHAGEAYTVVDALEAGQCQSVRLPITPDVHITFTRPDGSPARLISLPLPQPAPGARYIPFGDEMVLVASHLTQRGGSQVLDLYWRTIRPIVNDYAVSVRFLGKDGEWLSIHDIQPGLGALPTLKWVTRNTSAFDPHPYNATTQPSAVAVAVYERFRFTPLPSSSGEIATFPLP